MPKKVSFGPKMKRCSRVKAAIQIISKRKVELIFLRYFEL